jgi:hypothetical protein
MSCMNLPVFDQGAHSAPTMTTFITFGPANGGGGSGVGGGSLIGSGISGSIWISCCGGGWYCGGRENVLGA